MREARRTVHFRRFAASMITIVMFSSGLAAAAEKGITVTLIEVQGNRRIESATILAKIGTKEGKPFSPTQLRDDITELYRMGHFDDVQVRTEGFEHGLKVIFAVKEKPLVREVSIEGTDAIDSEELRKSLTILPRSAFNEQVMHDNAEKLRLRYQDTGYYNAVVVPVVTQHRGGDRSIVYYVNEADKVKLRSIIITGAKAISEDEIKKQLKTQEHWFFSALGKSGTLRKEDLQGDIEIIRNLYYNQGYIQVQVDEPVIEMKIIEKRSFLLLGKRKKHSELAVRIHVREGDQFRVGAMSFKGNAIISESELKKEMKLSSGDIFSRERLRQDVGAIIDRYDGMARPFANVTPLFDIDAGRRIVAITMDISEGGEVRIGRIDITGNTKTRDKVIRREMRLDEGDLYNRKALKRSYERLYNLNYFETVDVAPERRGLESVMDLNVKVKEKLTGTLSIGGGYSSVDGLIGLAEVTQGNFLGRGQVVKFKTQWGGTRRTLVVSFREPYLFDQPIWGQADVYNQTQDYDGYSMDSNGAALSFGKSFGEYVAGSIRYGFDKSTLTNYNEALLSELLLQQLNTYGDTVTSSAITVSLARDSRDYFLDPKKGSRNSIFVEYAGGPLGGDPSFIKSVVDSGWYFPLFGDTSFMLRGRFGYAASLIDKPLPSGERFFVGGTSTVRGFKYGGAGPVEPVYDDLASPTPTIIDYTRIGGTRELIFNAEFNFPIVAAARLKGVLFYDIGKAFDDGESIRLSQLRHAVGWGFRWFTPVGPLRFEWGYIVNQQTNDLASQFEFSIGTIF